MSDLKKYLNEQDAIFAIQDEFERAEADARITELATASAILFKAARKCGFDEDAASRIAADLIKKNRPDLLPNSAR